MDFVEFFSVMAAASVAGFVLMTLAYYAGFRVFGTAPLRPGLGKLTLIHFLSWWAMAAVVALADFMGVAELPDPWGPLLVVVVFYGALAGLSYGMATKPDRKAALVVPVFPSILFALAVLASYGSSFEMVFLSHG